MDSSIVDHSDSDSGDSWTLLESTPTIFNSPDLPENAAIPSEREAVEALSEKDEDTDGISIISDSDPESMPCDASYIKTSTEESHPVEEQSPVLTPPPPTNINLNNGSMEDEPDFLGDNVKYKTYVHRRNPKVGTILDIIMLGTFVITAGMALGHLWSCKNECTPQTSVNKILSNLYKLQEENAYLRNKLKEITHATGNQILQQQKTVDNRLALKRHRCKKVFEEPIMKNIKAELAVKCVNDNKPDIILQDSLALPEHEKEFLSDIGKMKDIYEQNKNWLDEKIKVQFEEFDKSNSDFAKSGSKIEVEPQNDLHKQLGPTFIPLNTHPDILHVETDSSKLKSHIQSHTGKQLGLKHFNIPLNTHDAQESKTDKSSNLDKSQVHVHLEMEHPVIQNANLPNSNVPPDSFKMLENKITYADSLKIDQPLIRSQRSINKDKPSRWIKDHVSKRKHKEDGILLNFNSFSDDDIKKDNRYTGIKIKHEKKKHDRQKSNQKQKRNNKYEQWEMKGGYLKDFDEFSISSSQDNDMLINKPDKKFINPNFESYINNFIEIKNNSSGKDIPRNIKKFDEKSKKIDKRSLKDEKKRKGEVKDSEWYNQRSALRAEARMKLERELFGEDISNNAGWYFRRMQRREQCRTQKGNSTFKKFSKRKMNYKMKR